MIQGGGGGIEWKGLAVSIFLFLCVFCIFKKETHMGEEGNGDECGRLLANNPILKCICVCFCICICICICICLMRGRKGWWVRTTPCQLIPAWRALRLSPGHHRTSPPGMEFKYCLSFYLLLVMTQTKTKTKTKTKTSPPGRVIIIIIIISPSRSS